MNWWDKAACQGLPDGKMADDKGWKVIRAAKTTCNGCPVRQECLTEALENHERTTWGMWGGFTTGERDRLLAGQPVRTCPNCMLDYVYQRCYSCAEDRSGIQELLDRNLARVRELNHKGHTDSTIATVMSNRLNVTITRRDITSFRWRSNIPPPVDPRNQRKPDTYEPANVDRVLSTARGFGELTNRERVALMRHWLNAARTVTSFCRQFNVNTSTARNLVKKVKDTTWMTNASAT